MGKLNLDKLNEVKNRLSTSNADFDKLEKGKNVRRVLFPKGNSDTFFSEGFVHFGLGAEANKMVVCPKTKGDKHPCPVCEYVEKLKESKKSSDKKLASAMSRKRRAYINVLNRDEEDASPKILPIGSVILKGIIDVICEPDYGDITDYKTGRDITITKKGEGMNTEYAVLPKPMASVASKSKTQKELDEEMADLDTMFTTLSYEELESILNGEEIDTDDEFEEDYEDDYSSMSEKELLKLCKSRGIKIPKKYKKSDLVDLLEDADSDDEDDDIPFKGKESSDEEDEDDSDEEDEDDSDEEDEDDSDEEDEDDSDEEDESSKPVSKSKKSADAMKNDINSLIGKRKASKGKK